MNSSTDPAAISRPVMPLSRIILLLVLVGLVACLVRDMAQRKAVAAAEAAVNQLLDQDLQDIKDYISEHGRTMPVKDRVITRDKIQALLNNDHGRTVQAGESQLGSTDDFIWGGVFYRYVLKVEYDSVRAGATGAGDEPDVLIASKASMEQKLRFLK